MTGFSKMFPAESFLCRFVIRTVPAPECFAAYCIRCTVPFFVLQNPSHYLFTFSAAVYFGIVKKIYAVIIGNAHQFISFFIIKLFKKGDPATIRKNAKL